MEQQSVGSAEGKSNNSLPIPFFFCGVLKKLTSPFLLNIEVRSEFLDLLVQVIDFRSEFFGSSNV